MSIQILKTERSVHTDIKNGEKCPYRLKTELVVFIEIENREKCRQQDELDPIKSKTVTFFIN